MKTQNQLSSICDLRLILRILQLGWLAVFFSSAFVAQAVVQFEMKPAGLYFEKFAPVKAPAPGKLFLHTGDRLVIIGDSITHQKMYSCLIETYLTVCVPELKITARQLGWGGETAEVFRRRMTNDCLRFNPTIATLCYGMNDHRYRAYDETNAQWYSNNYSTVVSSLKSVGARVVLGSPGCVGKNPHWATNIEDLNLNLCRLRNIDIAIADQQQCRFADVFWPMFTAGFEARQRYDKNYPMSGRDGVHPGWSGHLIMAYAFLKAMGIDGDIGTFTVDLQANCAKVTAGHTLDAFTNNTLTITSYRYPFCATGEVNNADSIRSGMTLVPFNLDLNRLKLVVKNGKAINYQVTWGNETHAYSAAQLADGVNIAADFAMNPFTEAFNRVSEAVVAKQTYETRQILQLFHGPEGKADPEATAALTEKTRQPLVDAIQTAFVPVTHRLKIEPK